jgi:hypothetical protein
MALLEQVTWIMRGAVRTTCMYFCGGIHLQMMYSRELRL